MPSHGVTSSISLRRDMQLARIRSTNEPGGGCSPCLLHSMMPVACTALPVLPRPCQGGGSTTVVGSEVSSSLEEVKATTLRSWLALKPACAQACVYEPPMIQALTLMKLVGNQLIAPPLNRALFVPAAQTLWQAVGWCPASAQVGGPCTACAHAAAFSSRLPAEDICDKGLPAFPYVTQSRLLRFF